MEWQGRRRCVRATAFRLPQAADPLDHVIGGELLEFRSMTVDLLVDRGSVAIDRIRQASLGVAPRCQCGLDCLPSRQIGLLLPEGLGSD